MRINRTIVILLIFPLSVYILAKAGETWFGREFYMTSSYFGEIFAKQNMNELVTVKDDNVGIGKTMKGIDWFMAIQKKNFKKIIIALLILSFVISSAFIWARYGWKLWGFQQCVYPSEIYISNFSVYDDFVVVEGNAGDSAGAYVGYITEISDRKLYIGLKYNVLFGYLEQNGSFSYKIPFDRQDIDEIYLASEHEKRLIWPDETSDMGI